MSCCWAAAAAPHRSTAETSATAGISGIARPGPGGIVPAVAAGHWTRWRGTHAHGAAGLQSPLGWSGPPGTAEACSTRSHRPLKEEQMLLQGLGGVRPVITLHHFTPPPGSALRRLEREPNIVYFLRYAERVSGGWAICATTISPSTPRPLFYNVAGRPLAPGHRPVRGQAGAVRSGGGPHPDLPLIQRLRGEWPAPPGGRGILHASVLDRRADLLHSGGGPVTERCSIPDWRRSMLLAGSRRPMRNFAGHSLGATAILWG
jgi:hypothetical protein